MQAQGFREGSGVGMRFGNGSLPAEGELSHPEDIPLPAAALRAQLTEQVRTLRCPHLPTAHMSETAHLEGASVELLLPDTASHTGRLSTACSPALGLVPAPSGHT